MLVNKRNIQIEWGDCDPLGIVYFPRYFEFFDACTDALFERAGLRKQEMLEKYKIGGIPLVEARARFLAPSSFGDTGGGGIQHYGVGEEQFFGAPPIV